MVFPVPSRRRPRSLAKKLATLRCAGTTVTTTPTDDGIDITVVIVEPDGDEGPVHQVIVYSYGNHGNVLLVLPILQWLSRTLRVPALGYDYAGYGTSGGLASEADCTQSLKAVVDFALRRYAVGPRRVTRQDIVLMGGSMGTGVVVDFATSCNWYTPIILVSPFKSLPRVVCDARCCDDWLPAHRFASIDKISQLRCPARVFHGERDELVHVEHGKDLNQLLPDKTLSPVWISEAGHHNIYESIRACDMQAVLELAAQRKQLDRDGDGRN